MKLREYLERVKKWSSHSPVRNTLPKKFYEPYNRRSMERHGRRLLVEVVGLLPSLPFKNFPEYIGTPLIFYRTWGTGDGIKGDIKTTTYSLFIREYGNWGGK